ncbi:pyridoxamine 5'-phosphate oxidase family protein [Candidatus Shapirobacteria bacterium]|nr:pyridoxamine 5'-phosphate oxidase family protein [Candidatus Shapirobacteria bacterium]
MLEIPEEIKKLCEKSIIAFSTCSPTGQPNTVAVACAVAISPNQVLVTDNFFNKTRQNLINNQQVSLTFWNLEQSLDGAGYQFKGTAQVITTGELKEKVDQMECNQGLAHKAAILVTITEIWDLANPHLICQET